MRVTEPEKKEPANSKYFSFILVPEEVNFDQKWHNHYFFHHENRLKMVSASFRVEFVSDSNEIHKIHEIETTLKNIDDFILALAYRVAGHTRSIQ